MNELWRPKMIIEQAYQRAIHRLLNKIWEVVGVDIIDPYKLPAVIQDIVNNDIFTNYAQAAAKKMVMGLFSDSGRTWREAALANMQGQQVYKMLQNELRGPVGARVQELIDYNATLIKTLPSDIANDIVNYTMAESFKGRRSEQIAKEIESKIPHTSLARSKLIARTETSKASTALTQARSEELDINWYVWKTSEDQRVRSSHKHMDGVLINWNNPPSPEALIGVRSTLGKYQAGSAPNCRCYPEPLMRLDMVSWPMKVYYGSSIARMTRSQFERVM